MKSFMQTEKGLVRSARTSGPSFTMVQLTRLSVLVAESDAKLSEETLEQVAGLGVHEVVQARGMRQALEALRAHAFDILLCAEHLTDGSGLELLDAVRQVSPATRSILMRAQAEGAPLPDGIAALRRPFSAEDLQQVLQPVAAPAGGLWCEVPQLSLADILQMYHQGRRSISVMISGPIAGRVRLEEGEIVDAQTEDLRGLPALSRLLEADSGLLRTEIASTDATRTISGPFQFLILQSAQRLDERRRDSSLGLLPDPTLNVSNEQFPLAGNEQSAGPAPDPRAFATRQPAAAPANWLVILAALLAVVAFVFSVRSYLVHRAENAADASRRTTSLGLSVQERPSPPAVAHVPAAPPAISDARPPSMAALPVEPVEPGQAEELGGGGAPTGAAAPPPAAPAAPDPVVDPAPQQATESSHVPSSFQLSIVSRPPRATVLEGNQVLGKTPLRLDMDNAALADGPREFVVQLNGYHSHKISQSQSKADVRVVAVLTPRQSAAAEPAPNTEPAPELGASTEGRSPRPRQKLPDLGIRLRR
jgi:CheY-like chemotaxis protein